MRHCIGQKNYLGDRLALWLHTPTADLPAQAYVRTDWTAHKWVFLAFVCIIVFAVPCLRILLASILVVINK